MKSLEGELEVIVTEFDPSAWEHNPSSLWRSPSSPPYSELQSRNPFASPQQRASNGQSTPSTPSEFEFDSPATLEMRDEPPVSPKFISSFATGYWAASSLLIESNTRTQISSDKCDAISSIDQPHDKPTINTGAPLSHPKKQPSIPAPSPSVRQLITEEMHRDEHDDDGSYLDFYSAPQTPAPRSRPLTPKHRPLSLDYEQHLGHVSPSIVQRKSKSTVLDRRDRYPELATTGLKGLTPSKSEPHARSIASTSSSPWDKSEEEKPSKKPGTSKSFKKWAFKDFLRRTVPSSKTDAHFMTRTLEAASSSRSFLSNPRSTPISPQASPRRSHIHSKSRSSTLQTVRPSSRAPRSPSHCPPSTHGWSSAHSLDTHSEACSPHYSSTPSRTPPPSPPRSPLSPHLAHYKLQKNQSQELGRKTFLPYRQSLLGCLGGSGAFSSDQLVW